MSMKQYGMWGLLPALMGLAGCQPLPHQPPVTGAQTVVPAADTIARRQDSLSGVYEVVADADGRSVFVASTPSFDARSVGQVYRLDAHSLALEQTIQLPRRSFALAMHPRTGLLYVGNTLDGSLTVVDPASGVVQGRIQLAEPDAKGDVPHTRKIVAAPDSDLLFVTSPGREGLVWIVDARERKVLHTIQTGAPWTAGAAYDTHTRRLYVGQGGRQEILAIDPAQGTIVQRLATGDGVADTAEGSRHFFVNVAIDPAGRRLFGADANTGEVYVFGLDDGQIQARVRIGPGLLDVLYDASRNRLYATNRGVSRHEPGGTGQLTIVDGQSYAIQRAVPLPVHPNSLALSPDGRSLYVTVKAPHGDKHPESRLGMLDSVVRIHLD